MAVLAEVLADLAAEGDDLDQLIGGLEPSRWRLPTPAPGWTIAHQVGHLEATDRMTALAVTDPAGFAARRDAAIGDFDAATDAMASQYAAQPPAELLAGWRTSRAGVISALGSVPDGERVTWMVAPLSPAALASTRMMELIGHGLDVRDAVGATWAPTDRIAHLAWLGVRTRDFAYANNGLAPPEEEFRVELTAPSGKLWTWGPADAVQRVTGSAADFCLLVTRRRHRADLRLEAQGADADRWLDIAQAYVGPPSPGRQAGQFPRPA